MAGHPHPIYITIHPSALHPHPFTQGMNEKACIYTIFKVITQSEILALSFIRAKRKNGVPEKYCKANFLGGGETNEANLKGLLANLFLLRNLFGRAGVPPSILHYSFFILH